MRLQKDIGKYIVSSKEILGGTPVFKNTRVPVKGLFDYLKAGDSLNEFLDDFPSVKKNAALQVLQLAEDMVELNYQPDETSA